MKIKLISLLLIFCIVSSASVIRGNELMEQKSYDNTTAVDDLGRKIKTVEGVKEGKYVGLFYFLWLGQQNQKEIYDITNILGNDTISNLIDTKSNKYKNIATYFFNEPLYGYYNSSDPWILRKHIELFIAADIDFLAFDVTNGIYYDNVVTKLLDILEEYRADGWKVPQIVFFTNLNSGGAVNHFYNTVYKQDKYKELWFYGPYDKPLIIAKPEELSTEMLDFFYVRPPQWPLEEKQENGFPYMNISKPQDIYTNLVNVSVSQFSGPCSYGVTKKYGVNERFYGRGYSSETKGNNVVKDILAGRNFEEQWKYAIDADPDIVFVTGWNEWIAQKSAEGWGWIDTFNTEWSRDIEMTRARSYKSNDVNDYTYQGYGDNFYMQLVDFVRRYKGISNKNYTKPQEIEIDVSDSPSEWGRITGRNNVFYNIAVKNLPRDYIGASPEIIYNTPEAKNFIREVKVTNDKTNLYFYIKTEEPIKKDNNKTNILNILLSLPNSKGLKNSWEGYHYIINRKPSSEGLTSLEKVSENGDYVFTEVCRLKYSIQANIMQIEVPLKSINQKDGKIHVEFKVCDSQEHPNDILDYYVSGSSAPIGRMNFVYKNIDYKNNNLSTLELVMSISGLIIIIGSGVFFIKRRIRLKGVNHEK